MGGLSAGVHLATEKMNVLVVERFHKVGGHTSSFSRGCFNFESSMHEMDGGGEGGTANILLKRAGVWDKVKLISIPVLFRAIMPDLDFTYPSDPEAAIKALTERWPEEKEGIEKFYQFLKAVAEDGRELKNYYRYSRFRQFFARIGVVLCRRAFYKYLNSPLQEVLDDHFTDDELKAVMSQLWVYFGPPPSRLWAPIYLLAANSFMYHGAWHIEGSSQALADAYVERITELGGTVRTGVKVTSIMVEEGTVQGIKTEMGETLTSRYVVSNADPYQTFLRLVGEDKAPEDMLEKLKELEPSNSLVGVYLGLDVEPDFWGIKEHEIFYSKTRDADAAYKNMMDEDYENGALIITLYSNLGDPWYSPPGKSVVVLHSYADPKNWPSEREQYLKKKKNVTDTLIALAEEVLPGLRDHIEVMETATPRTIETYTNGMDGIPYGWNLTVEQGRTRLGNATGIDGLYLAGSWTLPAHGVSGAQISGYRTAQLILDLELDR